MRYELFGLIMLIGLAVTGCSRGDEDSDNQVAAPEQQPVERSTSPFTVYYHDIAFSLRQWDSTFNLNAIFQGPYDVKYDTLGPGADTFIGSVRKKVSNAALSLVLFSPRGNLKHYYILEMNIKSEDYVLGNGLKVGDSLEKAKKLLRLTEQINQPVYFYVEETEKFILLRIRDNDIEEIQIYYELQ